jgi:MIP family channel proteins
MIAQRQAIFSGGNPVDSKILALEFIGTFALTYVGSWAIIFNDIGTLSANGVALANALVILIFMGFAISISGAHFNPAITLGMVVSKRIDLQTAIFYFISQFVGAFVAAGFIYIQMNSMLSEKIRDLSVIGIPRPGNKDYEISGFWGEVIGSFTIMLTYLSMVADSRRHQSEGIAAPAFAFAIYICTMTIGEISGAGLNPARSIAPALIAGQFTTIQFVHFFGPFAGCLFATIIYNSIYGEEVDSHVTEDKNQNQDTEGKRITVNEEQKIEEFELRKSK